MISAIIAITFALIGFIKLNTPCPLDADYKIARHKRACLTQIVLSIGVGAVAAILEVGLYQTIPW